MIIKQSTINTIAGIASFLMALLLGGSVYFAGLAIQEHNKAVARQAEFKQLGIDLADASDYLTDEARKFAVTGNIKHLQNYWKEIEVTKTRDQVLAHIKESKAPLEEFDRLKLAKQNSDALVATETRSMRLVLEAQGTPKSSMHPAVAAWQLSGEDIKLSAENKKRVAREIMFDAQYEADKHIIMEPIAQFQRLMNARTAREVQAAQRKTQTATFVLVIMVFLILMGMGIVLWVFQTQLSLPVAKYINELQEREVTAVDFALTPTGTQELRLLAEAFNQQFRINQQQLKEKQQLIEDIVQVSQGLAEGNLQVMPKAEYQGDFAPIKNALETTLSIQQQVIEDIVKLSQGLADGNLHIMPKAEYRGDFIQIKNAIETTLTCLQQVIEDIVRVSKGLVEGHLHIMPDTEYRGDFVQIKKALESAAAQMAKTTAKNAEQNWLKTGQTQLNDQLSGEQEVLQLAENTINFMTPYLEAQIGALYLFQENPKHGHLKMIASHAYTWRKKLSNEFKIGEGLVGQVALERKTIIITEPPVDYICIQSGLGRSTPRTILVTPFLYENTLKGIIELASFKVFTEVQIEFINQAIAIGINSAQSRQQMQELLQQTQAQSEELQGQTEELQSQQAALQQSNEELQSQSEELQTQQEELRHANEELEERTGDLEQQKEAILGKNIALEKSQQAIETKAKELELASQYKSEFLANMSHELRTPLNSLLILAQLLKGNTEGNLTDKQVEYARTIHSAGNDLLTLINEILDLSKVEAGKIEVHLEDMPLAALVETVEQKFRHVAQKKGLALDITVADDLPPVLRTDAQRLQQIINNLLSNAFKFTDKGEIKLDIKLKSPQGDILAFSVADTGAGIPKEKHKVIFEAFQQADGSTSRRYGGTGLGLSISRQLARLLGGELQLDSEEGKGSTFTLYLPLDDGQKPEPRENRNPVFSKNGGSQESRNQGVSTNLVSQDDTTHEKIADDRDNLQPSDKSILVIEDDRQFYGILMQLARERGFKCLVAEDGKTGLLLADEYQPHAIILDVRLPQLDGWSVMERLKDNPQTRHIPVGSGEVQTTLAETLAQANEYLNKTPFDCIVVDIDVEKGSGIELLKQLYQEDNLSQIPVILYALRELTAAENQALQQCETHITVKAVKSRERLLDETTLFLHQVEANLPQDKRNMLHKVHDKEAILKNKKVLIVDDDMRNTFALATVLEDKQMEIVVAENGNEALGLLDKHPDINIVLMDIMMPELDGYEAMQKIRAQERFCKLPIIALTAKAMKGDKAKCIEAGANDYLSKPVDTDKLISLMRVWLYQ
ncbi:MAG: hypothetical protein B6247_23265 [Candidatus Parabeggiatoa sp. nov. 2]|nr:MAG: hypothetical protein B6247_23265 [Beggiatoa sp. 4572_84]